MSMEDVSKVRKWWEVLKTTSDAPRHVSWACFNISYGNFRIQNIIVTKWLNTRPLLVAEFDSKVHPDDPSRVTCLQRKKRGKGMETDLWSDPHHGFMAEMFLMELLWLVSPLCSVLSYSPRGDLSLPLSLSLSLCLSVSLSFSPSLSFLSDPEPSTGLMWAGLFCGGNLEESSLNCATTYYYVFSFFSDKHLFTFYNT